MARGRRREERMLQLKDISKQYKTGSLVQKALQHVTVNFRDNEFVAVLGPSGSGKTTLLNIIGGLDHYDEGELTINGTSTKAYKNRQWDAYRNHMIGFVFQSYNLIPHQTILSNVELALTIGGVSRLERRKRAIRALEQVGLGDQLHKKPNQLSGGQMQRVAIARALVNDPQILLADEPTGALDTQTSIQVMDLLKKVASDRLVIMVTHNPELADRYATRIVNLRDGCISGDTNPYEPDRPAQENARMGKSGMTFATALALSFQNLCTKKGRTILTAFAGSIGIIGIALILSLSTGVNKYITDLQKEAMTSYPITINETSFDLSEMTQSRTQAIEAARERAGAARDGVYSSSRAMEARSSFLSSIAKNNLTAFKQYLESPDSEISQYLGELGIAYSYAVDFSAYSLDPDGNLVASDATPRAERTSGFFSMGNLQSIASQSADNDSTITMAALFGDDSHGAQNFTEMMSGTGLQMVSQVVRDSYKLLYGRWPARDQEVVLVVNNGNTLLTTMMYQLGLITGDDYQRISNEIEESGTADEVHLTYEEVCAHPYYLLTKADLYTEGEGGTWKQLSQSKLTPELVKELGIEVTVTGVVQAEEDAVMANLYGIAYSSRLTESMMERIDNSPVVTAQKADPEMDILTGKPFSEEKGHSYEGNLKNLGVVSMDTPSSISIFVDSFEAKDGVAECIEHYNENVSSEAKITYTDYISLLTTSVTSMVNAISYVLIAFVAVSLIVSCIMIGIITHISVLERTREIGILRALGASRRNISQVFNAETVIIGLFSGILGIGIANALMVPINSVIYNVLDSDAMKAFLTVRASVILVVISVVITVIGGLLPARRAAKMDPVAALRSE